MNQCESAVQTEQQSCEHVDATERPNAGEGSSPGDLRNQFPSVHINDGFMGIGNANPILFRFADLGMILIGYRTGFVLHHVANVGFIA